MRLLRYFIFIAMLVAVNVSFAGSVVTQKVVNVKGFVKGSTKLNLKGKMTDSAMQSLSDGKNMAVYNYLDSYLCMPALLSKPKTAFGMKDENRNISVKTKNGKFKWAEKDVSRYFAFEAGNEKVELTKASLKSSGTVQTDWLNELESKKLALLDAYSSEQGSGYLASFSFTPEMKKGSYKTSLKNKEQGIQIKVSVNSKGKASASYKLPPMFASPALLDSEYVFTNMYDYTLEVVGEGKAESGFVGPDQVELRVTENPDKFRFFSHNGVRITNDFVTLQLEDNSDITAVFGTYDLSVDIYGNGFVGTEFIGPDTVEIKVLEGSSPFRYFVVNGEMCTNSFMTLELEEDTEVEAVFGTYRFSTTIVGEGELDVAFTEPDAVLVKVREGSEHFRFFTVNGEKRTENTMALELQEDTEVEAVFGTYDLSVDVVGNGSVFVDFTGPDEAEVKALEGGSPFRYFTVNGEKRTGSQMTLELQGDTEVEAVFGTYNFSADVVGDGTVDFEFTGPDMVKVSVPEGSEHFRYFVVNGEKCTETSMTLELQKDTEVKAVFGTYDLTVTISGKGSVNTEFIGPDKVRITPLNGEETFQSFSWNDQVSYVSPLILELVADTVVTVTFVKVNYLVVDISGGYTAESWPHRISESGPDVESDVCRTTELWLKFVPAGEFRMGSPESEYGRGTREVAHQVTLTKGFFIGVFELTRKQCQLITGTVPASSDDDLCPVTKVTFDSLRGSVGANWPADDEVDAGSFMGILRAKTGLRFDLPTEAQWEYACRATTTTAFNNGKNLDDDDLNLFDIAYYKGNASAPQKVGSLNPNAWGLYDMHGNVWEWCLDWYTNDLGTAPVTDPVGLATGNEKTLRGGSFNDEASACRSAYRAHTETDHTMDRLGVRPVINQ
ncbi:SUMF1/EgtB/PvdO family nonheme iron enzyme [bacterium]|nr:SUMF1/EgtB/PvdO family nonheme iron enzyme [bacterium]